MEDGMAHSQTPEQPGVDRQRTPARPGNGVPEGAAGAGAQTEGTAGAGAQTGGEAVPPAARVVQLEDELAAAKAEASANWDKFLRERADMENFKRRVERTSVDQTRRERKTLLLQFLNVLDNLERALSYHTASGKEADVSALLSGIRLTESQFRDLLANAGVSEVPSLGEAFDPAKHEAVATVVATDVPEGQVVEELQKGYRFGDELLRPARVRVATRE
jgi:molecular chaperone GrpE